MGNIITSPTELTRYLNKVAWLFDVESLLKEAPDRESITDYYLRSGLGYSLFHSRAGAMHMALNYDAQFNAEGLYGQALAVEQEIMLLGAHNVLEVGSGQAFNLKFLAKRHPAVSFTGVDLTPQHIPQGKDRVPNIENVRIVLCDFEHLPFGSRMYDLVFAVESWCHASDIEVALSEVYRVLEHRGRVVVFDGFRDENFNEQSLEMQRAVRLVEITVAVKEFQMLSTFVRKARNVGFRVASIENRSQAIMPNLGRFQYLARAYFKVPAVARFLRRMLGERLVENAIAGLLIPFAIGNHALEYYQIVLDKSIERVR